MAAQGEQNWQRHKTVLECNKYMLDTGLAADVVIKVNSPNGSTEEFAAHRYMLMSRSSVFQAQLCYELHSGLDISDIEPETFRDVLRYIYYEQVSVNTTNVLPILYAARKYVLDSLAKICTDYAKKYLSVDNVCEILNHSAKHNETELKEQCALFMDYHFGQIMSSDFFLSLTPDALSLLLDQGTVNGVSEDKILQACLRWAKARIGDENAPDIRLREELGKCLYKIRFPTMSNKIFSDVIGEGDLGLLNDDEKLSIYRFIAIGENNGAISRPKLDFNINPRNQRCVRLNTPYMDTRSNWTPIVMSQNPQAICFSVDHPVILQGISIYTSSTVPNYNNASAIFPFTSTPTPITYTPTIEILTPNQDVQGTICQEVSSDKMITSLYFNPKGVPLDANVNYSIVLHMKTSISPFNVYCPSNGGQSTVVVDNVRFSFSNSDKPQNITNIACGQIPELIFFSKIK